MTDPHDCTGAIIRFTANVVNDREVFCEEFLKILLCVCRAIFQLWRKNVTHVIYSYSSIFFN